MKTFALLLLAAFATGVIGAEMYRWVDDKGVVNYTPFPPPANIKNVETKKFGGNTIQTSDGSFSLQQATKNFPVTLYATDCGELCNNARAHLKKRGIPYQEKNPTAANEGEEFKKLSGGGMEIPLLVIGTLKTIKGYLASDWDATFDQAGYPSTAVPGVKPAAKPPVAEKK
ncbi:MAG: glutaredoxin family protein [Betaproteobacteria bacterium]